MPTARVKVQGGAKLRRKLREIAGIDVGLKVGFWGNPTYPDGARVAYVAYLNEYGGHNPPRPFLDRTAKENGEKWLKGIENILRQTGVSQSSALKAFDMAGQTAVGNVKRTIADWPENDPYFNAVSTVMAKARRGRNGKNLTAIDPYTVLIDTGRMISAVNYYVQAKKVR